MAHEQKQDMDAEEKRELAEEIVGDGENKKGKREKIEKASALYYPPAQIGEEGGARCGKCMMFVSGHCTVVEGPINGKTGVCGLYVHGKHAGPAMKGTTPKSVVGYVENGPTHCGNCDYYEGGESDSGACKKIDGTVEAEGCCNFWEAKEEDELL